MGAKIEKVFGIIVIVIPTMAIIVGVWLVWGQHQKLTQFQPIEATVLGKEVGQRRTSGGDLREYPVVEYEYDVGGERYSSDEVFLFPVNATTPAGSRSASSPEPLALSTEHGSVQGMRRGKAARQNARTFDLSWPHLTRPHLAAPDSPLDASLLTMGRPPPVAESIAGSQPEWGA